MKPPIVATREELWQEAERHRKNNRKIHEELSALIKWVSIPDCSECGSHTVGHYECTKKITGEMIADISRRLNQYE